MRYVSWEYWKGGHIRGWALQVGPVDDEGVVGPVDAVEHHEDAREQIHRHLIIALASLLIINPIITNNISSLSWPCRRSPAASWRARCWCPCLSGGTAARTPPARTQWINGCMDLCIYGFMATNIFPFLATSGLCVSVLESSTRKGTSMCSVCRMPLISKHCVNVKVK